MAIETDAQLMLNVKAGDEAAFELLLAKYRTPVVKFVYRMVQNAAVAEELAQEVFLRVYRARAGYEPSAKFTTWLFRIATHIALNALRDGRKERSHQSLDAPEEDHPPEVAETNQNIEAFMVESSEHQEIRRAVQTLPAKQRVAVILHKYQELDYREIAESLECSESAVKSLLFRAYETLRLRLAHFAPPSATVATRSGIERGAR